MKQTLSAAFCFLLAQYLAQSYAATFFGPTPYLSRADIPPGLYVSGAPTVLETFEGGALDPSIIASAGRVVPPDFIGLIDSVDADDGVIDGSGLNGHSWFSDSGVNGVMFTFPRGTIAAGLVWTDGNDPTVFSVFGAGHVPLGQIGPFNRFADNNINGATAEDRFFGVRDPGGIESIFIASNGGGIEVDHVQYELGPSLDFIINWQGIGPTATSTNDDFVIRSSLGWLGAGPIAGGDFSMDGEFWSILPAHSEILYAGNYADGAITQFTLEGIGSTFSSNGVFSPIGLAVDSSGNVYVGSYGNGTIEKYTPEGVGSIFAGSGLSAPLGMAFDSAGNLYVANQGNNSIEKFTPDGNGSVFASGLANPVGLAFDRSGNLYAANYNNNTIEKFSTNGVSSIFASSGLANPTGLAFDGAGNLFVANYGSSAILKFAPDGASSLFTDTNLFHPFGLAFDRSGNLYAVNQGANTIEKFTPAGVGSVFAAGLNAPYFIAFSPPTAFPSEPFDLRITAIEKIGTDLRLSFTSAAGKNYAIQTRDDLSSGDWSTLPGAPIPGTGLTIQVALPNAFGQPRQFYRVQVVP